MLMATFWLNQSINFEDDSYGSESFNIRRPPAASRRVNFNLKRNIHFQGKTKSNSIKKKEKERKKKRALLRMRPGTLARAKPVDLSVNSIQSNSFQVLTAAMSHLSKWAGKAGAIPGAPPWLQ